MKRTGLRFSLVVVLLLLILGLLCYKLVLMQTVEHEKLKTEGENRSKRSKVIKAYRGEIFDRNGNPLAISTPVDTIWIDPYYLDADDPQLLRILDMLGLSDDEKENIIVRIKQRQGRSGFVYLKRQVSPFLADKIEAMNIPGIHFENEFKRFYPDAAVTSQLVGFTDVDGNGQEGVELEFDKYLRGKDGKRSIHRDLKGGVAAKEEDDIAAKNGKDIVLSIDRRIQYLAYKYIKEGVIENKAAAGSAVIIDVDSGEILAMVNYPSFNPNNMTDATAEKRRNRTLTDVYEPGSVIKPFTAVAALESGKYDVDSIIDTSPGYYRLKGNTVRDFRNYGEIDLRHVLMKSSNVGISRIILSLDANILADTLRDFGFGGKTGITFPGERSGYVPQPRKWGEFPLATLSFGYGMNATVLQLAAAYSIIANGGKMVRPTLLKRETPMQQSLQVIKAETSKKMIDMLRSVVEEQGGTAPKARTQDYLIAGKTGTVRKAIAGGYATDSYMVTFVGIAPASDPKIVTVVMIDDPKGESYGGGSVAAPISAKINEHVLKVMAWRQISVDKAGYNTPRN
ncbi:MAG: peptidoglycan D,D-transpeptidase FtsI family protein [Francisellaceae bacterium]